MFQRKIVTTTEGTKTLHIPEWNESYHSQHGALQEAEHVFINNGLNRLDLPEIHILEMGFGTGLNAFLTLCKASEKKIKAHYHTLEKYPISVAEYKGLEYWNLVSGNCEPEYTSLHEAEWETETKINNYFYLTKYKRDFFELAQLGFPAVNLVYYDAFGARVQPNLWNEEIFVQIFNKMAPHSLLTTYSSKGSARRAMQQAGFVVEKLSGPRGKREMVNAWKK